MRDEILGEKEDKNKISKTLGFLPKTHKSSGAFPQNVNCECCHEGGEAVT